MREPIPGSTMGAMARTTRGAVKPPASSKLLRKADSSASRASRSWSGVSATSAGS